MELRYDNYIDRKRLAEIKLYSTPCCMVNVAKNPASVRSSFLAFDRSLFSLNAHSFILNFYN